MNDMNEMTRRNGYFVVLYVHSLNESEISVQNAALHQKPTASHSLS